MNISVNMRNSEKIHINYFVGNKIVRVLKKIFIEIGLGVHELWSKK